MSGETLVLGIGNDLLSDDGVGVHLVRRLEAEHSARSGLCFMDGGTLSFTLAVPLSEVERLVVVDAAELGSLPGTVRVFEGAEMDAWLNRRSRRSAHEVGLLDLMTVARLSDSLPARRALVGIQPRELGWGSELSEPVAAALPQAGSRVMDIVERWRSGE